ncbi:hypothetical protein U3A55_08005 [Salarchaeum sp. III]
MTEDESERSTDEMLPDERAAIVERLDELDDTEGLTVDEVADDLGVE